MVKDTIFTITQYKSFFFFTTSNNFLLKTTAMKRLFFMVAEQGQCPVSDSKGMQLYL